MREGEVLVGRYRVERILGTGGMGVVLEATDLHTEQRVALKRLAPERSQDGEAVRRMLREAGASTRLAGRHTGRVFDVLQAPEGEPVLVMELLHGEDLSCLLERRGAVPEVEAAAMVMQACEGLAEAHAVRMIHRDIKPSNLFLARDLDGSNVIKVIDFGMVKTDTGTDASLTRTSAVMGSVAYMAPEQLRKLPVDARADVWALGVVLYELVAGRRPFSTDSITDASIRIAIEPPDPLPAAVSTRLAATIARCLEKDPAARFQDVGELADALALTIEDDGSARRIQRILEREGAAARRFRASLKQRRSSIAHKLRDALADHWLLCSIMVCLWSLGLLLGSFAADDRLNELSVGVKRTGYLSSFNWTVVHTVFCPITVALAGALLAATRTTVRALGGDVARAWDRRARALVGLWIVMAAVLAVGYTVVEWSYVMTGRCDRGTYLGWPNQLCTVAAGSASSLVFMAAAAIAQVIMLAVSWFLLSTVIWMCELFFGKGAPALDEARATSIGKLFGVAAWGWAGLFVALYLARLWSVHLRAAGTDGVLSTVFGDGPGGLWSIDAHTQTDWGSMVAGAIMLVAAVSPFVLLRLRVRSARSPAIVTMERAVTVLGLAGLIAMVFPRLGFMLLPAVAVTGFGIGSVRRALVAAWPRSGA